jgi:hypothetical protein
MYLWTHIQSFSRVVLFKCCCVYGSHGDLLNVDSDWVGLELFLRFCIFYQAPSNDNSVQLGFISRKWSAGLKKGYAVFDLASNCSPNWFTHLPYHHHFMGGPVISPPC